GCAWAPTPRPAVRSAARTTAPLPPLPSTRSIRYLPSITRRSRSCTMATLLVMVAPSPPETSAPHDEQNLLFSGIGVWQRKHSSTGLVIGASCPDGAAQRGGRLAGWPPRDERGA